MRCEVGDWVRFIAFTGRAKLAEVIQVYEFANGNWYAMRGFWFRISEHQIIERRPGGGA